MSSDRTTLDMLLNTVAMSVHRYVVLSRAQADAIALWVAHTHALVGGEAAVLGLGSFDQATGLGEQLLALSAQAVDRSHGPREAASPAPGPFRRIASDFVVSAGWSREKRRFSRRLCLA